MTTAEIIQAVIGRLEGAAIEEARRMFDAWSVSGMLDEACQLFGVDTLVKVVQAPAQMSAEDNKRFYDSRDLWMNHILNRASENPGLTSWIAGRDVVMIQNSMSFGLAGAMDLIHEYRRSTDGVTPERLRQYCGVVREELAGPMCTSVAGMATAASDRIVTQVTTFWGWLQAVVLPIVTGTVGMLPQWWQTVDASLRCWWRRLVMAVAILLVGITGLCVGQGGLSLETILAPLIGALIGGLLYVYGLFNDWSADRVMRNMPRYMEIRYTSSRAQQRLRMGWLLRVAAIVVLICALRPLWDHSLVGNKLATGEYRSRFNRNFAGMTLSQQEHSEPFKNTQGLGRPKF